MKISKLEISAKPKWIFMISFFFGLLPFLLYFLSSFYGKENYWYNKLGYNHGPWRWELIGNTIFYPLLILFFITLYFILLNFIKREFKLCLQFLAPIVLNAIFFYLQLEYLYWLID